jgi:predicted TIM-barrel fold metal-dependent hydrolase
MKLIIDNDVHPMANEGIAAIFPYLPAAWSKRLEPLRGIDGVQDGRLIQRGLQLARGPAPWPDRKDAIPPTGGAPGSDVNFVREHHLDRHHVDIAVLLSVQAGRVDAFTSAEEAAMVVRGMNDYCAEHWLAADKRFRMAMVVAPHDPRVAAAEIRRFGPTAGVVSVWIPLINIMLGRSYYEPIYEAAEEFGLSITLHPIGHESDWQGSAGFAGGVPATYVEKYILLHQVAQSNLASLIFGGTLDRHPKLRFVFTEYGWTWLPALLWRMDAAWKAGRQSVPWVVKPPSEYVKERIRFTTEPALEIDSGDDLQQVLKAMHASRTLMFSSDYPHWDSDEPNFAFRHLDPALHRRIFSENAIETYGERLGLKESVAS